MVKYDTDTSSPVLKGQMVALWLILQFGLSACTSPNAWRVISSHLVWMGLQVLSLTSTPRLLFFLPLDFLLLVSEHLRFDHDVCTWFLLLSCYEQCQRNSMGCRGLLRCNDHQTTEPARTRSIEINGIDLNLNQGKITRHWSHRS